RAHQPGAALALRPVADLVVVLQVAEEAVTGHTGRRAPVTTLPEARVLTGVDPGAGEGGGELSQAAEVGVVAGPLAGEDGVQRVVEVVAPLRVEAVAADGGLANDPRVVEVALRDHEQITTERAGELRDARAQRFEEMGRGGVEE